MKYQICLNGEDCFCTIKELTEEQFKLLKEIEQKSWNDETKYAPTLTIKKVEEILK